MNTTTNENLRSASWQWWVSGLLLLATMINYMDRQTLSNMAVRITEQFQLSNEQYGDLEFLFGVAFACGSLFFGVLADRVNVRLLYPCVLVAWSAVGCATGMAQGYHWLMVCRGLLGFFEAGHWPCALIVTQQILSRGDRVMGNSLLQSGASVGAILTPLIIRLLVSSSDQPDAWRLPFYVIGATGAMWAVAWLVVIRPGDLTVAGSQSEASGTAQAGVWQTLVAIFVDRRFWALAVMVVCINTSWQLIRAWLPKFMQQGRGYSEVEALYFNSAYFIATDVGCILAGICGLWLVRAGWPVHASRILLFFIGSLLVALTTLAAWLPAGWPLLATLLVVGAGALALFPCYYSFTQEVSARYMGRLTGLLSFIGWMASAPTQKLFGYLVDRTGSYDLNLAILGWAPLLGLLFFWLLWPTAKSAET
ncbi:MAG: MFS transporter [Pirellulaceae bacterium]|nr:MFS transporter [Pirellulaceae bacterium]